MFKKILIIGVMTLVLSPSIVYGEEPSNIIDASSISPQVKMVITAKISELEKCIADLEAKGYSKDQILEIIYADVAKTAQWTEITNSIITNATTIALVALLIWAIKTGCTAYTEYKDMVMRREHDAVLGQLREMRRRNPSYWY